MGIPMTVKERLENRVAELKRIERTFLEGPLWDDRAVKLRDAERKIIDQELTDLQLATEVAELDDRVREARRQIQAGLAATLAVAGRRR
jgi:hypothetical protein